MNWGGRGGIPSPGVSCGLCVECVTSNLYSARRHACQGRRGTRRGLQSAKCKNCRRRRREVACKGVTQKRPPRLKHHGSPWSDPPAASVLGQNSLFALLQTTRPSTVFDHASLSAETLLRMCDIANTMCSLSDESSLGSRLSFNAHTLLHVPRGPATAKPPQGQD